MDKYCSGLCTTSILVMVKLFFPGILTLFSPELSAFIAFPFHFTSISLSSTKRFILSILKAKYRDGALVSSHSMVNVFPFCVALTSFLASSILISSAAFKVPRRYCHSLLYDCKSLVVILKFGAIVLN